MSELGDAIERLELWARGEEFDELTAVIAAARERDALAAVIDRIRKMAENDDPGAWGAHQELVCAILSRNPSDVLVERDARIRAEVIDWVEQNLAGEDSPAWARSASRSMLSMPAAMDVVDSAREHFGLTKGASDGER